MLLWGKKRKGGERTAHSKHRLERKGGQLGGKAKKFVLYTLREGALATTTSSREKTKKKTEEEEKKKRGYLPAHLKRKNELADC